MVDARQNELDNLTKSQAYNKQLATEIQASIADERPNVPHDEVMDDMNTYIENAIQSQS